MARTIKNVLHRRLLHHLATIENHNAVNRFEDAELPGLPRETLLAYVCDAYRDVKVGEPPERWRDTAGSSLKRLVKAGVLSQVDGNFSRPLH